MRSQNDMGLRAWGDESVRMSLPVPSYLMAASWFEAGAEMNLSSLERIKPSGARKLHWMDMNGKLKAQSIAAVAEAAMLHAVVVACELPGRKQERARRKCLEALLPYLEGRGIDLLTLESRGTINDRRDVEMLLAMRRSCSVGRIDICHRRGEEDTGLWVPDQVLGAYAENRLMPEASDQSDSWKQLEKSIHTIRVEL